MSIDPPPVLANDQAFGEALAPEAPRHRALRQLHGLLAELDPSAELEPCQDQLVKLARWIRSSGSVPATAESSANEPSMVSRFRFLVRALESFPEHKLRLAQLCRRVLDQSSGLVLFAKLGIPTDRGFWSETVDRLSRRFLPEPVDPEDLAQLLARLFPSERDVHWFSEIPGPLLARFLVVLGDKDGTATFSALLRQTTEALVLLGARISATGLSEPIRQRARRKMIGDSPFSELPRLNDALRVELGSGPQAQCEPILNRLSVTIEGCRLAADNVLSNLETTGVSVDVVYRLELLQRCLDRYWSLARLLGPAPSGDRAKRLQELVVQLLRARLDDRKLSEITRSNTHLLARKIIERAGQTGEHYITSSRGDYAKMLFSAGGGGVLTALTCAMKYLVLWGHFAPFVEGVLASANYAASFILMQFLGFTLATKQPSMTAAALAGSMRDTAGETDLAGLVKMIARITRSQLAAAVGNLGLVIPAAYAFDQLHRLYRGRPFLDEESALHVIHTLHPTHSGTILYGALTGVLLWMSSLGAGWLENWAVYRRLPEAIAEHRYRRFLGRRITTWASRVFARNIAGIGGNTTLGVLLGMTPVVGKFVGLPLDVRHVTLSTGALTLAVSAQGGFSHDPHALYPALLGILCVGVMNFGVSFALALAVALRARQVERSDRFNLFVSVIATFLKSPAQFVFPPRLDAAAPVHGPVSIRASRPPPAH